MNLEGANNIDLANLKLTENDAAPEKPSYSSVVGNAKKFTTEDPNNKIRVENLLNRIIDHHYETNKVSEERLKMVEDLVDKIQNRLRKSSYFGEQARVNIIGSLVNGLGTNSSDVDLCVRLKEDEFSGMNREQLKNYVSHLVEPLNSLDSQRIESILTCRVPIVKFEWKANVETKFDVDISFYNILSLHNSELIKKYCEWEPERLPKLILFIKKWAKQCNIGSACQGALSSYAYTLMVIYYIQNIEPPVLPKLQERDPQDVETLNEMVDGANVYFRRTVLANWSGNKASVAELLIGFMGFYADFPHAEKIISICGKESTPESRMFKGKHFRIEDPFDINHNIGKVVRKQMAEFIKNTLKKTHEFLTTGLNRQLLVELESEDNLKTVGDRIIGKCIDEEKAPIRKLGYRKNTVKQPNPKRQQVYVHNNAPTAQVYTPDGSGRYPMRPPAQAAHLRPPRRYLRGPPMAAAYPTLSGPPIQYFNPYALPFQAQHIPAPPMWAAPPGTYFPPNQNPGNPGQRGPYN